jgi:hypothetical protein
LTELADEFSAFIVNQHNILMGFTFRSMSKKEELENKVDEKFSQN